MRAAASIWVAGDSRYPLHKNTGYNVYPGMKHETFFGFSAYGMCMADCQMEFMVE